MSFETHDFKNFPELRNNQMGEFYFDSPHRQITESFTAKVVKVIDGDTIRVKWSERDFDFPVRIIRLAAAEITKGKNEEGGTQSQKWLSDQILGKEVTIMVDKKERVEKWGRLLGAIIYQGVDIGEESIRSGMSVAYKDRKGGAIIDFNKMLDKVKFKF